MNLQQVVKILKHHKKELQNLFFVRRMGIFGSYARGKETKRSDIDILVEFAEPIGLIQFSKTQNYLSELLGIKVDLVTKNALRPSMKDQILNETIYL